jgi:tetratricopeptide (TPR) repeat protein
MAKLYEVLQKLKTSPDKKRKRKRKLSLRTYLLFSLIVVLIFSGIILSLLMNNIKREVKIATPKTQVQTQFQEEKTISQQNSLENKEISSNKNSEQEKLIETQSEKKTKDANEPIRKMVNSEFIKEEKARASVKSFNISKLPERIEEPLPQEGFFLNKKDLLNNLLFLAEEERKKGNCRSAVFYYQNYLKEIEDPLVMNNYGACLIEIGNLDYAINVLNKALSLKSDPEIEYNLIVAYFKKGDKEKACRKLKNLNANPFLDEKIKSLKPLCK